MSAETKNYDGNFQESRLIEHRGNLIKKLSKETIVKETCIAYHGTSLETIQYLLSNGVIPGYTKHDNEDNLMLPQYGDVYFAPSDCFSDKFLQEGSEIVNYGTEYALDSSKKIAQGIAWAHKFLTVLNFPIEPYSYHAYNLVEDYEKDTVDTREARRLMNQFGIYEHKIYETVMIARKRKGLVVGLDKSVVNRFPITEGDSGEDIRVQTGSQGLGIELLTSIMPLGSEEKEFIQNL